jgi:hypothetical protein
MIKDIVVLQNCTNSENVLVGRYGELYPGSHDASQAMNIKTEEVSDVQEDADPVQIAFQEIKTEPEVSCVFCMPTVWQNHRYAEMAVVLLAGWLSVWTFIVVCCLKCTTSISF